MLVINTNYLLGHNAV